MSKRTSKVNFSVLRDTKENLSGEGYFFEKDMYCNGTEMVGLETGDYMIKGIDDLVIERKATVAELAGNITEDRFQAEIIRMSKLKYPFLVCEFDWLSLISFPYESAVKKSRITGKFLQKKIIEYQLLGIQCCFLGSNFKAKNYVYEIFKNRLNVKNGA